MNEKYEKKVADPVIDQKIVKQKKHGWLWPALALLALLLLLLWFLNHGHDRTRQLPTTSTTVATTTDADNLNAQQQLQQYFRGNQAMESPWIRLDRLSFKSGQATPEHNDGGQVNAIASILKNHPDNHVVIRGFTDATGSEPGNRNLSNQRAAAIKSLLTAQQIDGSRITLDSQGAGGSTANNSSDAGRETDRYAAIKVIPQGQGGDR